MGQSKDGGYMQKDTLSPQQMTLLQQILSQSAPMAHQAAQGYQQFLPGGGGGQAITDQANRNFQQQTIPSILNAFGSDSKGSSGLNQALAAGASNLNTDLASMLSQMQLQASQGLGNLSQGQSQLGLNTPTFAYLQKRNPMWQNAIQGALKGGASGAVAGSAVPGIGTAAGGVGGAVLGGLSGMFN